MTEHNPLFLFTNYDGINEYDVFIGQQDQNDSNSIERCASSGPQKHVTKKSDRLHNHSTLLTTVRHVKSSTFVAGLGNVTYMLQLTVILICSEGTPRLHNRVVLLNRA